MIWARLLAYITGTEDQELLLRNEYLATENRILRSQIKGRLLLSLPEKATLAEIAHRLGRKALEEFTAVAKPDTLLTWYRKLIANKFDGSKFRKSWGRPRVDEETERLVVRVAKENPGWGERCSNMWCTTMEERNHQGKENRLLFPSQTEARRKEGAVRCRERLGGLLKYYEGEAA